jgi:Transposase IS200 like
MGIEARTRKARWQQNTMRDPVHLVRQVDPQFGIHRLGNNLKVANSHSLRKEFSMWGSRIPTLWTNRYLVSTVGGGDSTIRGELERCLTHSGAVWCTGSLLRRNYVLHVDIRMTTFVCRIGNGNVPAAAPSRLEILGRHQHQKGRSQDTRCGMRRESKRSWTTCKIAGSQHCGWKW